MTEYKAYLEHDGGFIDVAVITGITYGTAQGGIISVTTAQHASGAAGQVVAHLETQDPSAAPALLDDEETKALSEKLRGVAASLTVALATALAPLASETEGGNGITVRLVMFDQARLYWDIKPASQSTSPRIAQRRPAKASE